MPQPFRRRWLATIGIVAVAICGFVSDGVRAEARAQTDPYTGGVVTPPEACTPAALEVTPGGTLAPGQSFTLSTTGQRPNTSVNFYVADELVGSVATDAAGAASFATQAPKGSTGDFVVAVAGACGTTTKVVDQRAGGERGRGFARTGFELVPVLLAAVALIIVGRKLVLTVREISPQ